MNVPEPDDSHSCVEVDILDNALVMIAVMEPNGRISSWNKAAETVTGYGQHEVKGTNSIWKHLYPDKAYRASVTAKIAEILSTKNYFENFESVIRTRSGDSRIILWNTKKIDERGHPMIIAVGLDITEFRNADVFRESIIENANILIAVLDKGIVKVWNKAAEKITGYSQDEVLGNRNVWKRLYPDRSYRESITRQIIEIIEKNRYFENYETTIVTKSGEKRIIAWNTRQIGTGSSRQEIAIGRDITGRKQAEEALISYMTEMAMRLKGPVEVIRDNLEEMKKMVCEGTIPKEDMAVLFSAQIRNADQVARNVLEFQRAIAEKHQEIPEAYRKFLAGE